MLLLYVKPELRDLSQCSRIAFVRELRHLSQDKISEYLGLTDNVKKILTDKIIVEVFYPKHYFYNCNIFNCLYCKQSFRDI